MTNKEQIVINCKDCGGEVTSRIGGKEETLCPTNDCQRRFRSWSKRAKHKALTFYKSQPSTRRKRFRVNEDGRFVVSYVFEKAERYGVPRLGKLIKNRKMLQLLLTGLSKELDGPVSVMFPEPDVKKIETSDCKAKQIDRLDCIRQQDSFLFPCLYFRHVLHRELCDLCDKNFCLYYSGVPVPMQAIMAGEDRETDAPWRYPCWAGFTEFACPVVLQNETSAIFVKGQYILDSPAGRKELSDGKSRLEKTFPDSRNGFKCSLSQIRNLGTPSEIILDILRIPNDADGSYVVKVTSNDLYAIAKAEAKKLGRFITEEKVNGEKKRISEAVDIVQEYLAGVYHGNRKLAEQDFFAELFALFDVLPTQLPSFDDKVWKHTEHILQRMCEFLGFKNGALCVPKQEETLELRVLSANASDNGTARLRNKALEYDQETLKVLSDQGNDYFCASHTPIINYSPRFAREVNASVTGHHTIPKAAWIGYIQLGYDISPTASFENLFRSHDRLTPFMIMVLWDRVPWRIGDPADKISEQTVEFLKRVSYDLGTGIHSWLSVLEIEQVTRDRKRVIAENVHGLKTCIHLASNKAEILGTCIQIEEVDKEVLTNLLAGIRADLVMFRHQIELANLFTVMETGMPEYRIVSLESPSSIVRNCVQSLIQSADSENLTFAVDDRLVGRILIKCDPGALKTALMALLDNAIKYSFNGREINIRILDSYTNVIIEVENFGIGILPSDKERIFLPLVRGKPLDSRKYVPGTGIGLSVCQQVVKVHKGIVMLKSSSKGNERYYRGTASSETNGHKVVFSVKLPIATRSKIQ